MARGVTDSRSAAREHPLWRRPGRTRCHERVPDTHTCVESTEPASDASPPHDHLNA